MGTAVGAVDADVAAFAGFGDDFEASGLQLVAHHPDPFGWADEDAFFFGAHFRKHFVVLAELVDELAFFVVRDDHRPVADFQAGDAEAVDIIATAITLGSGVAYKATDILNAEQDGLAALHEAGWPDAVGLERSITVDHATREVAVSLNFAPGIFSRTGEIALVSEGWNPQFIQGLSPLEAGQPLRRSRLNEYRSRLNALEGVSGTRLTLETPDERGVRSVGITLEPAPRNAIEVALSYSTSEGGGATASWDRRNLLGEDQSLTVEAQLQTLTQGVSGSLAFPHWRRYGQTLRLNAGVISEETDAFDQQEISLGFNLNRALRTHLQYAIGSEVDFSRVTNTQGVTDTISVEAGLGLTLDRRDDPLEPTEGFRARAELVPTMSFGDTDGQYIRIETGGSAYWQVTDSWVLAARTRLGSLVGASLGDIPADHRFYSGGGGSVRGFDYQSLGPLADGLPSGGLSVAEAGLEMRWRDTSRWGGVVFIEAGAAGEDTVPTVEDVRAAIGIGARYYLDFAPVRIDLATPLDRRDGESAVHLYFSIGQAF